MVMNGSQPQFVAHMQQLFLESNERAQEDIAAALARGDDPTLLRLLHTMKSSSAQVGAIELAALAQTRTVAPAADCVAVSQNRAREKSYFANCGVPVAPYAVIETAEQLAAVADDLLPGILKTSSMGSSAKRQGTHRRRAA